MHDLAHSRTYSYQMMRITLASPTYCNITVFPPPTHTPPPPQGGTHLTEYLINKVRRVRDGVVAAGAVTVDQLVRLAR